MQVETRKNDSFLHLNLSDLYLSRLKMPPTKPSMKLFQFVSEEGLEAYRESEAETKAKRYPWIMK